MPSQKTPTSVRLSRLLAVALAAMAAIFIVFFFLNQVVRGSVVWPDLVIAGVLLIAAGLSTIQRRFALAFGAIVGAFMTIALVVEPFSRDRLFSPTEMPIEFALTVLGLAVGSAASVIGAFATVRPGGPR